MGAIEVSFTLNSSADMFADWLMATWKGYYDPCEQLQSLWQRRGIPRRLVASMMWVTKPNSEGVQTAYDLGTVVSFSLLPLSADRLEVRSTCSDLPKLAEYWFNMLETIATRWPEARPDLAAMIGDTESTPDGEQGETESVHDNAPKGWTPEQKTKLLALWPNDSYSYADIGRAIGGYDADYIRKTGYALGLPKRKPGRKSGR